MSQGAARQEKQGHVQEKQHSRVPSEQRLTYPIDYQDIKTQPKNGTRKVK